MALRIVSSTVKILCSKIFWFRAIQRAQRIQGYKRPLARPIGGRVTKDCATASPSLTDVIKEESKITEQGARFQTFRAKVQWNKRWSKADVDTLDGEITP